MVGGFVEMYEDEQRKLKEESEEIKYEKQQKERDLAWEEKVENFQEPKSLVEQISDGNFSKKELLNIYKNFEKIKSDEEKKGIKHDPDFISEDGIRGLDILIRNQEDRGYIEDIFFETLEKMPKNSYGFKVILPNKITYFENENDFKSEFYSKDPTCYAALRSENNKFVLYGKRADYFKKELPEKPDYLKLIPAQREIIKKIAEIGDNDSITFFTKVISNIDDGSLLGDISALFEKINPKYAALKLLKTIPDSNHPLTNLILASDLMGAEYARKHLESMMVLAKNLPTHNKFGLLDYAHSLISPSSDKTAILNLEKFYQENIKFEEYEVNQRMNEKEFALLQDFIGQDEKVLEMGCGTGRLLLEMKKAGRDIVGIDFTPRHIDLIREQAPDAKAFVADWHDTKMQGGEFDSVYSLGRNILHDYSFIDQVATFREANRLLKNDGKFIFDIPNREKGSYGEMVKGYANEMQVRGIKNFRLGSIYDSPDGEHFATRYTYSHDDIVQLCQITGFEITEVRKEKLETGKDDENIYYILTKKSQ